MIVVVPLRVLTVVLLTVTAWLSAGQSVANNGEVNQVVVPGTNHTVDTAAAAISAIGTSYDVRIAGKVTIVVVVEGAVLVRNKRGSVRVKTGQETRVRPGKKPSPPQPANPNAAIAWTKPLPTPPPSVNVALDANGGSATASSEYTDKAGISLRPASFVDDGDLTRGWESETGDPIPSVTIQLGHGLPYLITRIIIDPAATQGESKATDLKDFTVAFSLSVGLPDHFSAVVLHGHCQQENRLQTFVLATPAEATYAQVAAKSNYGNPRRTSIDEVEIVGTPVQPPPGTWSVVGPELTLQSPGGIAEDSAGNLYVSESGGPDQVDKISPTGSLLEQFGSTGSDPGQLSTPQGVAVDAHGNVYVADQDNNRIQKFGPDGTFLVQWGTSGTGPGQFQQPAGIAVDSNGNIYVADSLNARIQKLSSTGQPLNQWPVDGTEPEGVAVDPSGNVYVALNFDDSIEKMSPQGVEIAKFGDPGTNPGQLDAPWGVALDQQGNIFVTEEGNNRVEEFSPAGALLRTWGIGGMAPGQLQLPEGIVVDPGGAIFVADTGNGRIQKLVPRG